MSVNDRLTVKQEQFIQCLLAGHNLVASAKLCNIGEATARRWHKSPDIQARVKKARREMYDQAVAGLLDLIDIALGELRATLRDQDEGHAVKLRAAALVLDHLHRHMIDQDIDERLARIEERLQ